LDDETGLVVRIVGPGEVDLRRTYRRSNEIAWRIGRNVERGRIGDARRRRRVAVVRGADAVVVLRVRLEPRRVVVRGDVGRGGSDLGEGRSEEPTSDLQSPA